MTDDELMHAIAHKDPAAFSQLVERHLATLYAYAYRLTSSKQLAEDLVQDTWLAVWERASSYKPGKVQLTTWLHKVLHNRGIDLQRKMGPVYDTEFIEQQTTSEQYDKQLDHTQLMAHYDLALSALPYEQRAALLLAQVHGFNNKEVGRIIGVSRRAVESLQARGRRTLRERVKAITKTDNDKTRDEE